MKRTIKKCVSSQRRLGCSLITVVILALVSAGCGSAVLTGEDYGDISASPSSLILTESEHLQGWGRSECNICHVFTNIHIGTTAAGFNLADVRELVAAEGLSVCATCHGDNGVQ